MQTLLTSEVDRKVTLQKKKKRLKKRALVLRDAPRKPTAGRGGSETVLSNGSVGVVDLVLPLGFVLWRESGKVGLLAATRHGMHSMAYQLRS
jgi:hypothetical protein